MIRNSIYPTYVNEMPLSIKILEVLKNIFLETSNHVNDATSLAKTSEWHVIFMFLSFPWVRIYWVHSRDVEFTFRHFLVTLTILRKGVREDRVGDQYEFIYPWQI